MAAFDPNLSHSGLDRLGNIEQYLISIQSQLLNANLTAIGALNPSTANVIASDGSGWIGKTYAQLKTALALVAADVGLGSVTNDAQLKASQLDTDGTLAANSDTHVPSQKAVKTYSDTTKVAQTQIDTDGTLTANSDTRVASQKATKTYADTKVASTQIDTDGTLAANSDTRVASQKAIKTYVDTKTLDSIQNAAALKPFWAALGGRDSTPVDIFVIGTSISEGVGSSNYYNRWLDKFRDAIRHRVRWDEPAFAGVVECKVNNSTTQSISNSSTTALTADTETYDVDQMHSTSSNTSRIVISRTGVYLVTAEILWAANATSSRVIQINKNGSRFVSNTTQAPASGGCSQTISSTMALLAGDYLEICGNQLSGGSLNCTLEDFTVTRVQKAAGYGFYAMQWVSGLETSAPWTLSGSYVANDYLYGPGRRAVRFTTPNGKATASLPCTGFDILWAGGTGTGVGYYKVDGGASVTFSTTLGSTSDGHKTSVTGLTSAFHTIEIGWSSGGDVNIDGIMVYNGDESHGVRVWDGSHSGYYSTQYISPNNAWQGVIGLVQPSLVIIETLANEARNGVAASTMQTNITTLIANIKSQCTNPPAICLFMPCRPGDRTDVESASYIAAYQAIVAADPTVCFFNAEYCTYTTAAAATTDVYGLFNASDTPAGVHLSDKGAQLIADAFADQIIP